MNTLLALTLLCQVQAPATLADYLKLHPEEGGLVLVADKVKGKKVGSGLALYGRKLVHVGGVNAVAPLTMIWFEDNPSKPPNLYDGLARDAKILYLMSTLTAAQWKTAAGPGIGINNLKGEQKAVFLSILPKRLSWKNYRVRPDYHLGDIVGSGALDEKELPQTRLRIEQTLEFNLQLADQPRAYTSGLPFTEMGKPGETVPQRDTYDDDYPETVYGVPMRSTVPNVLKKGALNTSALNAAVTLPSRTTVGETLKLIGSATGREILADQRVRDLALTYPGGKARAGDLLDAISLCVAGTYRKVDNTYLLVPDVVGAGSRQMRQILWKESIDAEVERQKSSWVAELATSGLALNANFSDDPLLSPSPGAKKRLDASLRDPMFTTDWFPVDELSSDQRAFLDREFTRHKDQPLVHDKVAVQSELRYRFVLPDGKALQIEGLLGTMSQFGTPPGSTPERPAPAVPKGANAEGSVRPLVVRLSTVEDAKLAVLVAKAYGFSEIWAEAELPEPLIEAQKGGLPTRLFVRPWSLTTPQTDSDKTVTGETGHVMAAKQESDPLWAKYVFNRRREGYPRIGPELIHDDLMSPYDPAWPARRNAIATLARTPGLAGVVVAEATPRGYEEKDDTSTVGAYRRPLVESWGFGYDERQRLAFFRQVGYDPIDLTTEQLNYDVDFDTPYFPRYPSRPLPQVREAFDTWTGFRGKASAVALEGLRNALGNLPVLVEVRRTHGSQPPRERPTLAPWPLGKEVSSYDDQFVPPIDGAIQILSAPRPRLVDAMTDFINAMKILGPRVEFPQAFDLTRVPSSQWSDLLNKALIRKL